MTRLGVPQVRRSLPSSTPLGRTLHPAIERANGDVVFDSDAPVAPPPSLPFLRDEQTLPLNIEMLATNNVAVPPALLLDVFPWQTLISQPPERVATGELVSQQITKLYNDLQRWNKLGHLVNPHQAVEICKKFAAWMSLKDIERVLQPKEEGALDAVKRVLASDLNVDKFSQRHEQIVELLAENRVHEAYIRSQAALRALASAHRLIDSARVRVMEAQRRVSSLQWRTWAAASACVVVGVACDYFAAIPEVNLPIIEGALKTAALSGSVLCLSAATALYLTSDKFASYLDSVRDAHDAHHRVHMKLDEDVLACLDQGYIPQQY